MSGAAAVLEADLQKANAAVKEASIKKEEDDAEALKSQQVRVSFLGASQTLFTAHAWSSPSGNYLHRKGWLLHSAWCRCV